MCFLGICPYLISWLTVYLTIISCFDNTQKQINKSESCTIKFMTPFPLYNLHTNPHEWLQYTIDYHILLMEEPKWNDYKINIMGAYHYLHYNARNMHISKKERSKPLISMDLDYNGAE